MLALLVCVSGLAAVRRTGDGCGGIQKKPDILSTWQAIYPTSLTDDNLVSPAAACQVCHINSGGGNPWNSYGWRVRLQIQSGLGTGDAILAAQPFDSDMDPTTASNLQEIQANTQPGWTPGPNNTAWYKNGSTQSGLLPPTGVLGNLDPGVSPWTDLGSGLAGTSGIPSLEGMGTLQAGTAMALVLTNARAIAQATLVVGLSTLDAPFKGGVLVPNPDLVVSGLPTDPAGALTLGATWPGGLPAGFDLYFQLWIVDPAGPYGFAASNALKGTTP